MSKEGKALLDRMDDAYDAGGVFVRYGTPDEQLVAEIKQFYHIEITQLTPHGQVVRAGRGIGD